MSKTADILLKAAGAITAVSAAAGAAAFIQERIAEKKHPEKKPPHHRGPYEKYVKRPLDVTLSMGALITLSPIIAATAILVKKNLGSPVLFVQIRPGKDEKLFRLYKFRTMTDERDEEGELLPDEDRLTDFGKKLRSTSLDELPELLNIIKGDMAIVGPRPLLIEYLPRYNEHQTRRHEIRPGLTGYAQVSGRNSISWEEKFDNDIWYVEHIDFITDIRTIMQTVKSVLQHEGISSDSSATMEEFTGEEHI